MSARRAKRGNRKRSRARETSEMGEPTCQVSFWGQPMEIPPPLDAEDVRKGPCPDFIAPKAWESLQNLWTRFLKKKNRNVPFVWKPPTPIQLQSWSFLLSTQAPPQHAGQVSLLQMAPTGCGKTMAYAAPLLLVEKKNKRCSAVVVLVPTRELALQVQAECERAAGSNKNSKRMRLLALYGGGTKKADHIASLQECRDLDQSVLIAATPGRFLDILRASTIDSKDTEASLPATKNESNQRELVSWLCEHTATVVLDEADRLAVQTDLCQQVDAILQHFRHRSRTILCSATWPQKANYVWKQWIGDQHPCVVLQVDALSLSSSSSNAVKKELTVGSEMDGMGSATEQKDMSLASSSKELTLKETIAAHPAADWVSRIPTHLTQTVHVCSQHKKPRKLLTTLTKIHQGNEKHRQQPRGIVFSPRFRPSNTVGSYCTKSKACFVVVDCTVTCAKSNANAPCKTLGQESAPSCWPRTWRHGDCMWTEFALSSNMTFRRIWNNMCIDAVERDGT